jgi:hypothetical protein
MKRTLFLSLLLLIAGNGLMVTQAHAGFLENCKNQALQIALDRGRQQLIGAVCFPLGLSCLLSACLETVALPYWQRRLDREINYDASNPAAGDKTPNTIQKLQNINKSGPINIKTALALGIPLTALGTYLLFKK